MADRARVSGLRSSVRNAVTWRYLDSALSERATSTGRDVLDVVDVGGGTGGFAVPLAEDGHRVLVVDPSPDALAALERRAGEAGVTDRITAVQGDLAGLLDVALPASADAVLCHGVLEHAEDASRALRDVAAVLRPGGVASVLVPQRAAAVLARALGGHLTDALAALGDPAGRWGPHDPVPRRFTAGELVGALSSAGLDVRSLHGARVFADLVPSAVVDGEPGAAAALLALEEAAAEHPVFVGLAAQLHVLAVRTAEGAG